MEGAEGVAAQCHRVRREGRALPSGAGGGDARAEVGDEDGEESRRRPSSSIVASAARVRRPLAGLAYASAAEHGVVVAEDAEEVDEGAVANGGDARDGLVHRDAQPESARRRAGWRSSRDRPGDGDRLLLREEAREAPALGPHHPRVLACVVRVAASGLRPVVVELRDEPDDAPGQRQRPDLRGLGRGRGEVRQERLQLRPLLAPEGVVVGEHLHGGTRTLRHGDPRHRARSDCDRRRGGASSSARVFSVHEAGSRHLLGRVDKQRRRRRALSPLRGAAMTLVRVARTLPVLALLLVCAAAVPSPEW